MQIKHRKTLAEVVRLKKSGIVTGFELRLRPDNTWSATIITPFKNYAVIAKNPDTAMSCALDLLEISIKKQKEIKIESPIPGSEIYGPDSFGGSDFP